MVLFSADEDTEAQRGHAATKRLQESDFSEPESHAFSSLHGRRLCLAGCWVPRSILEQEKDIGGKQVKSKLSLECSP